MKLILSIIIILIANLAQAVVLSELIRPLELNTEYQKTENQLSKHATHPVKKIIFEGEYAEGYYYQDITDHFNDPIELELKLANYVRYFDEVVCPKYEKIFGVDIKKILSKRKSSDNGSPNKIILLFDFNLSYVAYHSHLLAEKYIREFILIDLGENINSNALKYRLPHELQHILRYQFNKNEEAWLNEGLSVFAEFIMAEEFPIKYLSDFKNVGNLPLNYTFDIPNSTENYFNSFFYVFYLYNHYGGLPLIQLLMKSNQTGTANVESALSKMKNKLKDKFQKQFYNFEHSFINYQLALVLNPFRQLLDSDGFFDLKLNSFGVPSDLVDYSNGKGIIPVNKTEVIPQLSARFYELDQKCVQIDLPSDTQILAVFVDLKNIDPKKAIQVMENHQLYCLDRVENSDQYLVLINKNKSEKEPFRIK